jgi:hypothetical protein
MRKMRGIPFPVIVTVAVVLLAGLVASTAEAQFQPGNVLAGVGAGKIKRFSSTGTLLQTLDSGTTSNETTGMCFDASTNLFGTLFSISQVAKYDNSGTLVTSTFGSGYDLDPESCIIDATGNAFVGQADGTHQVKKFDSFGTLITNFSPAGENRGTDWIDLAADQCTLFYTSEGPSVKRFNVCTNTQLTDFATGLPGSRCFALRIRPNQELLVACTSTVNRLSSAGAVLQSYPASAFTPADSFLFALNLDPDGTTFWTGGISTGNVYRINIASGAQVTSFNAGILGGSMAGLTVVGEIQVAQPTPTPTGPVPATATPTSPPAQVVVPTLSFPLLGLLALALAAAALLLMRR